MQLVFACYVGAGDLLYAVYNVPTICVARAQQRRKAAERLGLPRLVYDDVRTHAADLKGAPAALPAPLQAPTDSLTTHTELPASQPACSRGGQAQFAGAAEAVVAPAGHALPQKRPRADDVPAVSGGALETVRRDGPAPDASISWEVPRDGLLGTCSGFPGITRVSSPGRSAATGEQRLLAPVHVAATRDPESPFCNASFDGMEFGLDIMQPEDWLLLNSGDLAVLQSTSDLVVPFHEA